MTFRQEIQRLDVYPDGWRANIVLGDNYYVDVRYDGEKLSCGDPKGMSSIPLSYDTVLDGVAELIDGVEIPDVETDRFGEVVEYNRE